MMRPCLALLALLLLPRLCRAHDLWLESSADGLILRYGHRGGERLTIDAGKVKAIRCVDAGSTSIRLAAATFSAQEPTVPAHCDVESISASLRRPLLTPEADTAVFEASLTFVVPQ